MESQGAISLIRAELDRDDGDALRSVATCRAILTNRLTGIRREWPKSANIEPVAQAVGFDEASCAGSGDAGLGGVPESSAQTGDALEK